MSNKLLFGLAVLCGVLLLVPGGIWAQETCDPEIEDCNGEGECDPEVEDCNGEGECDPEVEDCDGEGECDPEVEDCDGEGECDPEVEDCDGEDDCNPEVEDCDGEDDCNPETENCDPCDPEDENSCPQGENLCIVSTCNPETLRCETAPVVCEQDDNLCTEETCIPELGRCESSDPIQCEEDDDICTTVVCQPETGDCEATTTNPAPEGCEAALCRTPGFYGSHADDSKKNSNNITQAIITEAGGSLSICGETITNTVVDDDASAIEALCVSPRGAQRLQLARQLTAAALNCVISGGGADCEGVGIFEARFQACNAACAASSSSIDTIGDCIDDIDCLNNGGILHPSGFCQTGTCSGESEAPCNKNTYCGEESICVPLEGTCHDQALVNEELGLFFQPPGPAASQKLCNDAIGNDCVVIGSGQLNCQY